MAGPRSDRVCVAQIGAAHGVRGEVRLKPFTEDPAAVSRYGPLETEDGARRFEIVSMRPAKDALVVRLRGIDDRNAAEGLRNLRLFVPRARLPATEDDETFYHADLVGLAVMGEDGAEIGSVAAVQNFGAGDLIEVQPRAGGPTLLVPFTKAAVPEIDLSARRIVVVLPPDDAAHDDDVAANRRAG